MTESDVYEITEHRRIREVRRALRTWLKQRQLSAMQDDASLVVSELATNALLYGGGWARVNFLESDNGGVRIEVTDHSRIIPLVGVASDRSMTGRGLALVHSLSADWGVESVREGKVVWAELTEGGVPATTPWSTEEFAIGPTHVDDGRERFKIALGNVPTDLLIGAKSHVDNLVREFTLAAAGAETGQSASVPEHLATLLETVVSRFAEARLSIKQQALAAAHAGAVHTRLELELPLDAADAGDEYLRALDEADQYCRAMRLLTLETPPQHKLFRHWYVGELTTQLRAAAAGKPRSSPQPFERRLLVELDHVAEAQRVTERAARLYAVAGALAGAATPAEVAHAVLSEGVAALGASGGGLLLSTEADVLSVPGTVGYDADLVERLRTESRDAELPAAYALRTGEPVWLESREERDDRFPELAGLEVATISMCAVPLTVQGRSLGALRFSFTEPRLFDGDERRFVLALAAQSAQALDRAQLQEERVRVAQRLQRSLLPPVLPLIPGIEVAAAYHPFGMGVEVGGDFYDVWEVGPRRWALAIGDVAGTGPESAGVTAQVRYTLRALTLSERDPVAALSIVSDVLLHAAASAGDDERFCSAILLIVDINGTPTLTVASAGHPNPILREPDGGTEEFAVDGTLLGVRPNPPLDARQLELLPGSTFVLFTDGLLEARRPDGTFFDLPRALAVVADAPRSAAGTVAALEEAVLEHTAGQLNDDVAILVMHAPE